VHKFANIMPLCLRALRDQPLTLARVLRTTVPDDIIDYLNELITTERDDRVQETTKKILEENLCSFETCEAVDAIRKIYRGKSTFYLRYLTRALRYWVTHEIWEGEYNGGPYALRVTENYNNILETCDIFENVM
jgi:hypothetical protein